MKVSVQRVTGVVIILVSWCVARQACLVATLIVFLSARAIVRLVVLSVAIGLPVVAMVRAAATGVRIVVLTVNAANVVVTKIV